jgi:tetratricopeptide (TPR) repeat protein
MLRSGTRDAGGIVQLLLLLSAFLLTDAALAGPEDDAGSAPTSREARDKALELFRQSEEAYQDGRFDEAARLLEQAYALHREPVLLYNLARAYEGMGELEKAIKAYKAYVEGSPKARDRGAIERRVETLEKQIREQKRLEEEKQRLQTERDQRDRADADADAAPEQPKAAPPGPGIWPWVTVGAGVAVIGVGAMVGVLAQSKRDDADSDPVHATSRETFRDAESMATTANVLFVVGGLVTAGGVTWIVLSRPSKTEQATLSLGVGPGNVALGGKW